MLGTLGTYTLSPADDVGLGQLRQRAYAAIVSGVNDDDSLDLHVFFPVVSTPQVQLRRFVAEGPASQARFSPMPSLRRSEPSRLADIADLLLTLPKWHAYAACRHHGLRSVLRGHAHGRRPSVGHVCPLSGACRRRLKKRLTSRERLQPRQCARHCHD